MQLIDVTCLTQGYMLGLGLARVKIQRGGGGGGGQTQEGWKSDRNSWAAQNDKIAFMRCISFLQRNLAGVRV